MPERAERDLLEYLRAKDKEAGRTLRPRDRGLLAVIWNAMAAQLVARKVAAGATQRCAADKTADEILPADARTARDIDNLRDIARRWGKRLNRQGM
jgi:hypothetical protein